MVKFFVTGASGFVGTEVTKYLIEAGYEVLGLARSDASAQKIKALGGEVIRGDLEDLDSLKKGAQAADGGVIHLGFIHDFANFEKCCWTDRKAVEALIEALEGSNKVFVYTCGLGSLPTPIGAPAADEFSEVDINVPGPVGVRTGTEQLVLGLASKGIRGTSVRLAPIVHGENDHAFLVHLLNCAKQNGFAAYVEEGQNKWVTVEKHDGAKLFVLAAEKGKAGQAYHAVGESIKTVELAEQIGKKLGVPAKSVSREDAGKYLGFLAGFYGSNFHAIGEFTKKALAWEPSHSTLFEDLEKYY